MAGRREAAKNGQEGEVELLLFGSNQLLCLVETQLCSRLIHEAEAAVDEERGSRWIGTTYKTVKKVSSNRPTSRLTGLFPSTGIVIV